jgi:hypothetical protein
MGGGITVKVHDVSVRIADGGQTAERSRAGLQLDGNPYLAQLRNRPIDIFHLKGHRRAPGHALEAFLLMNCEVHSVQKACSVKVGAMAFFLQRDPQPFPIEADERFGIGRIHQDRIQSLGFHLHLPNRTKVYRPRRRSSNGLSRNARSEMVPGEGVEPTALALALRSATTKERRREPGVFKTINYLE